MTAAEKAALRNAYIKEIHDYEQCESSPCQAARAAEAQADAMIAKLEEAER